MENAVSEDQNIVAEKKLLSALNSLPPPPDISKHVNVRNAKILATLLVFGFIVYHGVLLATKGSDSCKWLLSDGRFQGSMWQPYGCMMHTYTSQDARACMHYVSYWKGRNHIVFIGDPRIKELYHEFIAMVDGDHDTESSVNDDMHDISRKSLMYTNTTQRAYTSSNEHYEQPTIGLYVEYLEFSYYTQDYLDILRRWSDEEPKSRPTVIVTSLPLCQLSATKNISNKTEAEWNDIINDIAINLEALQSTDTEVIWNLQDPQFDSKHRNDSKSINQIIDTHNRAAISRFKSSQVRLWTSSRLIAQIFQKNATSNNETDHTQLDTQILLNHRCNGNMYYRDGTCCTTTEQPTLLQLLSCVIFLACIIISIAMFFGCRKDIRAAKTTAKGYEEETLRKTTPTCQVMAYEILKGFSKLGIIVAYIYLCDRTTFFMKENKSYTNWNFLFPLGYVMLIGLFLVKESKHTHILHRDQTDEMKGWMQLVILVYHFTGASKVLPIYMVIRCLVTAYVFLSAYGNFMYSWNTGDYSIHRFFTVIVRYNLLVICLCIVMNRPYMFYYFVPLITFWYSAMFITAAIWPRADKKSVESNPKRLWYLILKLIILVTLTTLLYNFEFIFEKIFTVHPIKPLFVLKDNTVHEWQFRWSLDRYSSFFGVVFALFVVMGQKYNIIQDRTNESTLFRSDSAVIITSFLSIASIIGYGVTILMCGDKKQCNNLHPYISFAPIVAYIFLRNMLGPIRTLFSPFFAWFGKFALELFVAQYHIWLAADTHGVLVLVPTYPIINVIITSFIFVFAAHELHITTAKLAVFLVPNDWKGLLRNLFVFIMLMVPVAFYSGSFNYI